MSWLLNALYLFALIVLSPWLLWRGLRTRRYRSGLRDKLFIEMMDRIEDETVRILFFLQVSTGGPVMPYPEEEEEEESNGHPPQPDPDEQRRLAAKSTMEDFTRNVQRKKDREMEALQFVGGEAQAPQQAVTGAKIGRNDPCPCGSGKKFKKCHGAAM